MRHPFQCLQAVTAGLLRKQDYLLAAAGSRLYAYDLTNGALVSSWPQQHQSNSTPQSDNDGSPPQKKQRLSSSTSETRNKGALDKPRNSKQPQPLFIELVVTPQAQHIVAATDEDKCVRVFDFSPSGQLSLLSERNMPKRPSALAVTPDQNTIICADKFGDVYALPLLVNHSNSEIRGNLEDDVEDKGQLKTDCPTFSASKVTVHTARNLRSFERQRLDLEKNSRQTQERVQLQPLLGHVSMITDLALASCQDTSPEIQWVRNYIITCDRDEHIRISRDIPQAHIIEGFCLGHREFISRVCVPDSRPDILVSGGGDDYLCVWRWKEQEMIERVDFKGIAKSFVECDPDGSRWYECNSKPLRGSEEPEEENEIETPNESLKGQPPPAPSLSASKESEGCNTEFRVAVSGIWALEYSLLHTSQVEKQSAIVVACEGLPALFVFQLQLDGTMTAVQTISLRGNVLDVATYNLTDDRQAFFLVSIDNIHERFSTSALRGQSSEQDTPVQAFTMTDKDNDPFWAENILYADQVHVLNCAAELEEVDVKSAHINSLYHVEQLRKRNYEN